MSLSLVVGSELFGSLRRDGARLLGRSCPAKYGILPASESLKRHLDASGASYGRCDDAFVLMGPRAIEFARSIQVPLLPLLPGGDPSPPEPLPRQIIAAVLEMLLPAPRFHGEMCGVAQPTCDARPNRSFIAQLVRLRGYAPSLIRGSMAVVLAELSSRAFTGAGIAFDGENFEFSLAHRGVEAAGCGVNGQSTSIDPEPGSAKDGPSPPAAAKQFETSSRLPKGEADDRPSAGRLKPRADGLSINLVREGVRAAADALLASPVALCVPQPICIVCCGSYAQHRDFRELFEETLRECRFPLAVDEIRIVPQPQFTVARGCLIHAELEELAQSHHAAVA